MEHITYNKKTIKKEEQKNCSMFHVPCSMKQRGFSLTELVVVLAIFSVIVISAVNIFVSMISQQRRILQEQELLNQTSYAADFMSRALRVAVKASDESCLGPGTTGYMYLLTQCNNGPLAACNGIKFINQSDGNACQEFYLDSSLFLKESRNGSPIQNILSDKLKINSIKFVINGDQTLRFASSSDAVQPKVTMLLDVQTIDPGNVQRKIVQTTVSQRNLNVP